MKITLKNSLIVITILSIPFATFAVDKGSPKPEYQLPEYKVEDVTLPTISKLIVPRISGGLLGHEVRMAFEITADGRAKGIGQVGISPDQMTNDLAATMKMALLSWKFEPAKDSFGNPVAVKVIMPVKVVKKNKQTSAIVSLILDPQEKQKS